jgi:flagellar FliJ protein
LGRQGRELAAETARLKALEAARADAVADPGPGSADDVDLNRARLDEAWRRRLADQVRRQGQRVGEATARTDAAREALLAAARERSVVERLREKRAQEHREAVAQEEQKQLDDVAGRLVRNQRGNAVLIVPGLVMVYILLFTGILKLTGILGKADHPAAYR